MPAMRRPCSSYASQPASALPSVPPATPWGCGIRSPMIGTFMAPSPESANYVEVGMEVGPRHGRGHHRGDESHE
jgi:biotin carboxyl carrier protein